MLAAADGYLAELYADSPWYEGCTVDGGTTVVAVGGSSTTGIDFALNRGGVIEGSATAADSGSGLPGTVKVLEPQGGTKVSQYTADGSFSFNGLVPGVYYVQFLYDPSAGDDYQNELYDNVPCEPGCDLSLGTPFDVEVNSGPVGVDFALARCPADSYRSVVGVSIGGENLAEQACERVTAEVGTTISSGARFRAVIEPSWASDQ